MVRRSFCAGLVCLATATLCLAGFPTNRFHIRLDQEAPSQIGRLMLHDGRLIVGRIRLGWIGDTQDAPDRWYIEGTRIKCSTGGGYLAYDPTGKDTGVFVVAKPPEGIEWKVTLKRRDGGERGILEAATGAMQGWALDIEEIPPTTDTNPGPTAMSGRVVLSKESRHPFLIERIYGHK